MKKEVDSFEVGRRIPACQLCATAITSTTTTDLHQIINMNGAKEPYNRFIIHRYGIRHHQGKTINACFNFYMTVFHILYSILIW